MNRRTLYTLAILLLIGAIAIAVMQTQRGGGDDADASGPGGSKSNLAGATTTGPAEATETKPVRATREDRYADLAARYGKGRTALSRQVAGNVVTLLEDAISMGEMMQDSGRRGNWGGGRWMTRLVSRETGVELKDEQQEPLMELYRGFRERELEKAKETLNLLKEDPAPLVELFLAGDALKREEMSESEYEAVVEAASGDLGDVINPLDRNNFRGGQPLEDDEFREGFESLLDDEQYAAYEAKQAENEAAAEAEGEESGTGSITEIPTMELETLDQAVGSAQQMASGFKQMMEGFGGLQELQPQLEGDGE